MVPQDSHGLFVIENTFHAKGGPARHLHYHQDEWFYSIEGEFILEVGDQRLRLRTGDSLLAPRKMPHVWAYVGNVGKVGNQDGENSNAPADSASGSVLGNALSNTPGNTPGNAPDRGRILIAFMPAGKMEAFFREVTKADAMPPQDPELWRVHGMELLGPPLQV